MLGVTPTRVPMRVRVRTPRSVIRPTVGLMLDTGLPMSEVLAEALHFDDHFAKSNEEIVTLLAMPVLLGCCVRIRPKSTPEPAAGLAAVAGRRGRHCAWACDVAFLPPYFIPCERPPRRGAPGTSLGKFQYNAVLPKKVQEGFSS